MKREDELYRIQNQHHVDIQRLWRAFSEKPPTQPPTGGPTGSGGGASLTLVRLTAALYRDTDSSGAVPQVFSGGAWGDGSGTVTIKSTYAFGYHFSGARVFCSVTEDGVYYPVTTGGMHFEGTAAASFAKAATGNITLTQSRGTVTATARYGAVTNGKLVSVHWDNEEKKFFVGDSEC